MSKCNVYTRNDLIFESSEFTRYTKEELKPFGFTDETIDYLVTIGLPKEGDEEISEDWKPYTAKEFHIYNDEEVDYVCVGQHCDILKLAIRVDTQGVYNMTFYRTGELYDAVHFNSSIEKWVLACKTHEHYCLEGTKLESEQEEEVKAFGKELRKALESIDKEAMVDDCSGWRRVTYMFENNVM